MSYSTVLPHKPELGTLKYITTHVFFPLQLPDGDDYSILDDHVLASVVASAAHLYCCHLCEADIPQWRSIIEMLENLCATIQLESLDRFSIISQLCGMNVGDIRAFLIRAQNVGVMFRKQSNVTVFESFEVSPKTEDVMSARGKLICSFPGPAIDIPAAMFGDESFLFELVSFLVHMNDDVLDSAPTNRKAQSTVLESRDTTHPRYITELLTGILRSTGRPADAIRISKRISDDVVWNNSKLPWRRSPLWLLLRVALQTSLERSTLGRHTYKTFILFFMCCLAKEKKSVDLPNDLLQVMSAKISRRLRKLGSDAPDWLSHTVLLTCTSLRSTLNKRWREVRDAHCVSPLWAPSQLDLVQDIQLSLLSSCDHLHNSLANHLIDSSNAPLNLEHRRRGGLDDFLSSDGAFFEEAYRTEPRVTLYDVEHTVEEGIDTWVSQVMDHSEACVKLEILANKYSSSALKTYGSNPEMLSIMLLTTIELWAALDKIAIKETPILVDYSPEVPTSLLEGLLLYRKESLRRLRQVYQYLCRRHSSSNDGWSVFSRTVTEDSFAVRFFRGSPHLQRLKARIEDVAQEQARKKVVELHKANGRHAKLQQTIDGMDHQFSVSRRGKEKHAYQCSKCYFDRKLKKMEINVHEWPLPAQQVHAEVVVFELDCPVSFSMWRTATCHLLVDLCTPSTEPKAPHLQLPQYSALRSYFVRHPRSRITLASDTKPVVATHYNKIPIPSTRELVCVNNGLTLYGFDSHAQIPISEALGHEDAGKHSTYQLPAGPYQNLQKYVNSTSHMSNEVLANQAACHKDLSLHEFVSFAHLRCGSSLQWLNILREFRGRSLSFSREEVHYLLTQAVSQVGPLEHGEWVWHQEIQRPSFCYALLEELEKLLRDIGANWLEMATMDTTSFVLRRLLASNHDPAVSQKALGLLRVVRSKVFSWTSELLEKASGSEEFHGFLRDAAAICRSTFDIDLGAVPGALHTAEDIKILLSSAILIHHHTPPKASSLPAYSQILLDRNRRLSLALENALRDVIQADSSDQGINPAVGWVWPDYRPGSKWSSLPNPNSRWVSCMTAATANQRSQTVHFNLLDGTLLVDGKPLGRLPNEIQYHPLYSIFFGKQVLEVVPGDRPGMDYSTRGRIAGHQVYFSLRGQDLVIRAIATDSLEIMELIPPRKLEGDLPAVLVDGHAHWLNLSTSVMEIRPLHDSWRSSPKNWKVDCTRGHYRMHRGRELLVDPRSKSWEMVSNLLKPLDAARNLIITVSPIDSNQLSSPLQLSVALPRYSLSFFIDGDGDLQSRNLPGMVYDENQSIGTLVGLVNQLVLRPKLRDDVYADGLAPRCVLIPEGVVSFQRDGYHVRVEIDTYGSTHRRITCQTYKINTDLGCLAGSASLTGKLFCAYLHALTSGCGPDPLTGRSGTEEALSLLQSASCWSIMSFGSREVELLSSIASMCPTRTWYPEHLRRMQKVEWLDLPVNSQHHGLYLVAKAIVEHYGRAQLFYEGRSNVFLKDFPCRNEHLLERGAQRVAYLFPSDFSEQPSRSHLDVSYSARDLVKAASEEHRAYMAATVVCRRTGNLHIKKNIIPKLLKSWKETEIVSGNVTSSLQYDRSWLAPDLPSIWLGLYNLLRTSDERKWFQLLFSLPAMAYASPKLTDLVPVFVAFATGSWFRSENPPPYDAYDLSNGYKPSSATLRNFVSDSAWSFERSPESSELAKAGETAQSLRIRQSSMYNDRRNLDANSTAEQFSSAWPCQMPPQCSLNANLYDIASLMSNVQTLFASCYCNWELKEHFARVQQILDNVSSEVFPVPAPGYSFDPCQNAPSHIPWSLTADHLFSRPAPTLPTHNRLPRFALEIKNTPPSTPTLLHQLISTAETNVVNQFQRRYVSALHSSKEHFRREMSHSAQATMKLPTVWMLEAHYAQCCSSYIEALELLGGCLGPRSESEQALAQSGQWPRITTHVLFRCLASNSPIILSEDWRRCLIKLALLALELQRARRLLRLHLDGLREELGKELENEGCDGWSPEAHPDWLLVQLQGNFLVRPVQVEVANEMITPHSGTNTAMQLNMGEGKSSVIVPIVAVDLANNDQLVRVIVPKALTAQMFHILVDRLGGLVNRRIYFVPFSRSLQVDHQKAATLHAILLECMKERGILVAQPEHILSLRLVSVEKELPVQPPQKKDEQLAALLLNLQKWLHSYSRDILDESDEILHVRYQLIYSIGLQRDMEGSPERWITTEHVLGLVSKHASSLRKLFPLGVEYERGPSGSFPHLRILHSDAGEQLIAWIVQDIMDGLLPSVSLGELRPKLRDAIRNFISCDHITPADDELVREHTRHTPLWGILLLLRGLLATGLLLYAFRERRWRVDYGLALTRTTLAVPYRAKDVPSQRAEFGHPDVAIILTCLSYYYGGLDEEQLRLSFDVLLKQEDPTSDYDLWVRDCPDIPAGLQIVSGINVKSL